MINLKSKTDDEIDELAVRVFRIPFQSYTTDDGIQQKKNNICADFNLNGRYEVHWNPTKNAQQIQDYLFPKLEARIALEYQKGYFSITIYGILVVGDGVAQDVVISFRECIDPDQINRITTECCIEAYEKLMEGDKKFKDNNVGDRCTWVNDDGEGGHGVVVKREPDFYWAKCDETGNTIEVNLRRNQL